jgi:hypothetical protein
MRKNYLFLNIIKLFTFCLVFLLLYSCEKDEFDFIDPSAEEIQNEENFSNFRRKVENPYTVSNMQMALDSITKRVKGGKLKSATGKKAGALKTKSISPNMLYIQFTPKTLEQEGLLKKDSTLALIDYPLGYEYQEAWFKNRAKLKEGEIPTYYTSVAIDRKLPKGVPHRVLAEMYLPQKDKSLEGRRSLYRNSNNEIGDLVDVLLNQAFKQTGNEGLDGLGILKIEGETQSENKLLGVGIGEKWRPEGTLRIWDDNIGTTIPYERELVGYEYYHCDGDEPPPSNELISVEDARGDCRREIYGNVAQPEINGSYVPLKGAQVLLRDTFTIGNEITNSDGYFSFDRLRGKKRYIIQWERYEYSIRNGSLFQAETRGPKRNSRWDHDIKGGDDEYHGMIHLGAYDYYYGARFGLTSPPTNASLKRQIKIAAREENDKSSYIKARRIWFGADISLQAWGDPSDQVYGTTVHELTHAAHRELDGNAYNDVVFDAYTSPCAPSAESCDYPGPTGNNNRRLMETWAQTVETVFVLKRYRDDTGNSGYEYLLSNFQKQTILGDNHYTSAGLDLMDNINQRNVYSDIDLPIDNVDSFNINQLEDALVGAKSWYQWRDNLKNTNSDMSDELDELFANWQD